MAIKTDNPGSQILTIDFRGKFISWAHAEFIRFTSDFAPGAWLMSVSTTEYIIRNAKEQVAQRDINDSLIKALFELTREVKRLDNELRRVRRGVQVIRRL
jgi:hypothetical protein